MLSFCCHGPWTSCIIMLWIVQYCKQYCTMVYLYMLSFCCHSPWMGCCKQYNSLSAHHGFHQDFRQLNFRLCILKEYTWNNYIPQKSLPQTTILPKYGTFPHWKLWCVCLKMCGNPLMHKNVNVLQFLNATNEQMKKKRRKKKRKKKKRKITGD